MDSTDELFNILIDNFKKILYPAEFIAIDLKFSQSELFTLLLTDRIKNVTMTELSEYINAPMSTSTGIVDRLIKKNLLVRVRSEADRRIVTIRLTSEGERLIGKLKEYWNHTMQTVLNSLSLEEKLVINKLIGHMAELVNDGALSDTVKLKDYKNRISEIEIH